MIDNLLLVCWHNPQFSVEMVGDELGEVFMLPYLRFLIWPCEYQILTQEISCEVLILPVPSLT